MKSKIIVVLIFLLLPCILFAQEAHHELEPIEKKHKMSFLLSHTHISEGVKNGKKEWLTVPSFGFDYNYLLTPKWSIGLHNDLIIETFKVQKASDEILLERTTPIASAFVAGFKPGKSFTYEFGFGGEFAKEGNLLLTRVGIEYGLEITEHLELITNFVYDIKWNHYDSFVIGVGISKLF
jgi:hypothetical protein